VVGDVSTNVLKRAIAVIATLAGAGAIIFGVFFAWQRIEPQFKIVVPDEALFKPTVGELQKQQIAKESAELQVILDAFSKRYPGQFGIVVTDLVTGASARVNDKEQMVAASLYKMFVAYGIYKQIDAGTLKSTSMTKDHSLTVAQCLDIMITISDNDCGYYLGNMVGWAALDADLARLGLTQTKVNNYISSTSGNVNSDKQTSAADVALFTEALYRGKLLSAASTKKYMDIMKATKLNTWLPSGLPKGAVIGHKTGALYNLVHDAGVVYAVNGDYLIVVMSRNWQNAAKQPPSAFADISRQLWNYFTSK
jgi:beta-lactamase class A